MKKLLALVLTACMLLSMTACGNTNNTDNNQSEAPQHENVEVDSLQYWLNKIDDPSQVLMSLEDIEKQNDTMMRQLGTDWEGGYYDINAFSETVEKEWLQNRICFPNVKNQNLYYKGSAITEAQWETYYEAYNLDSITDKVDVSYGVIVNNTPAFDFPTNEIFTDSSLDESENALQQTYLKMNEPVVVVWESADAKWYYVVANEYIGWIEAKDCAFFESRKEWSDFQTQEDFLIVTEDTTIEGMETSVLMSTKLYLADGENLNSVDGVTETDYIISLPNRDQNGKLKYTYLSVSKEEKVYEGYLPFTSENILTLAFQEMGDPYGWGGIDGKRDCSLYIKDIYNCFGFQMPRNSRIQMSIPKMGTDTSNMSVEEKEALLAKTNPGTVLGISGHVMMYLGEANGQHYVISMLGSYVPETVTEDFANHVVSANKVMVNTLDVRRKNGNTWLQEIIAVVEVK